MQIMSRTLIILLFLIFSLNSFGQLNDTKIRRDVLKLNQPDSLCVYGKWSETGETETHLKYLGNVTTNDGRIFKIMTSIWLWGYSKRATSRILIYNEKDQYVGNYYMTMIHDLPERLEDGQLIFTNTDNTDCDKKLVTKINLKNGLPKMFFIKCKAEQGDIYEFSSQ